MNPNLEKPNSHESQNNCTHNLMVPNLLIKQTLPTVTINIHYIITWYQSVQDQQESDYSNQQQSEHSKSTAIRVFSSTRNKNKRTATRNDNTRNHHKKLKIYFTNKRKAITATVENPDMVADAIPSSTSISRYIQIDRLPRSHKLSPMANTNENVPAQTTSMGIHRWKQRQT